MRRGPHLCSGGRAELWGPDGRLAGVGIKQDKQAQGREQEYKRADKDPLEGSFCRFVRRLGCVRLRHQGPIGWQEQIQWNQRPAG